jgi:hypothetical protein
MLMAMATDRRPLWKTTRRRYPPSTARTFYQDRRWRCQAESNAIEQIFRYPDSDHVYDYMA